MMAPMDVLFFSHSYMHYNDTNGTIMLTIVKPSANMRVTNRVEHTAYTMDKRISSKPN